MLRAAGRDPDAATCGEATSSAYCAGMESARSQLELGDLYSTLQEYLQLEPKFQPRLLLPNNPEHGEVSSGARDGAAHVMRCLKMWFDLPAEVFSHAINLLDRFLTKMKVRPCHVPCISVSCMNIGIDAHGLAVPVDELVSISQCGCTSGDVARMSAVVREKLSPAGGRAPVAALHWIRLLAALVEWAARELGLHLVLHMLYKERELVSQLEMVLCDAACANLRACEVALVLLFNQLETGSSEAVRRGADPEGPARLLETAAELARLCGASETALQRSRALVRAALERGAARSEHRQRLVWRLSSRTLKVLRPTDRFLTRLPTIDEQQQSGEPAAAARPRSGSESSDDLSAESADWPRSRVLPVYCDN